MNVNDKTARIAGFLHLLMGPLGYFAMLYVPSKLMVPGDVAATAHNILAHETAFRLSSASALLTQLVNIAVVLLLYRLLAQVNKSLAVVMVIFSLLAVPMAMLNEVSRLAVLQLLGGADYLSHFSSAQLQALAQLSLNLHAGGIAISTLFWGLWLFPMGYLVAKSGYLPKGIGYLLILGGLGYVIDAFAFLLAPDLGLTISLYTFPGELALPLWLLFKGIKVEAFETYRTAPRSVSQLA
ncbi:MAG: DUF4386 domain-containing protein [Candidatus Melainabacteria bacterium HGW-Melainabacteria-1]|nr:MAG: DUF4386 domain-containing protein [Candidatus Melainabacteria bacterium HGW-Melainabacteria-1]